MEFERRSSAVLDILYIYDIHSIDGIYGLVKGDGKKIPGKRNQPPPRRETAGNLRKSERSAVLAHEEQRHAARAGVGPDHRADGVEDDLAGPIALLDLVSDKLGVLGAVAVADEHGLGGGIVGQLAHLVHQGGERRLAPAGLGHVDEMALVVHMEHRLDLEHGAHHGGGGGHPPALFQEEQVVNGEVVALAQLVRLRPIPDLLHGFALLAQLGGLVDQHSLAKGGAQGVHHKYFAVRILLGQLLPGDLEGAACGRQTGGHHFLIFVFLLSAY